MKYLCVFCLLLCSCSTMTDMFEPDPLPPLNLPSPSPIKLEKVKFVVITEKTVDEHFKSSQDDPNKSVIIGLTGQQYKNLVINMQKLKSFIKEQRKIIELYKDYYEGENRNGNQN